MKNLTIQMLFLTLILGLSACSNNRPENNSSDAFSMVFMTDIHITSELNAVKGFRKAIDTINYLKPELVITGGDNIMDANAQNQSRADSLYNLYKNEVGNLKMPVYNAFGNHEGFGISTQGVVDSGLYNKGMFQKELGKNYYSFEHKNWKFFVLDAVQLDSAKKSVGLVSNDQLIWIQEELKKTKPEKPLAIILHIPLLTSYMQYKKGALEPNPKGLVVSNSKEVLNLFQKHKLRLVLQGHLHFLEDIYVGNIHFITGGAVSGGWWKGPFEGTQEGFVYLTFKGDNFEWKYIDYGWEPEKKI